MQCEEWADANSELFKEAHDETVHKNSYKRKLYELISASLVSPVLHDVVRQPPSFGRQKPCRGLLSRANM